MRGKKRRMEIFDMKYVRKTAGRLEIGIGRENCGIKMGLWERGAQNIVYWFGHMWGRMNKDSAEEYAEESWMDLGE